MFFYLIIHNFIGLTKNSITMKKHFILFLLCMLPFLGNAQTDNRVGEKFYVFEYETVSSVLAVFPTPSLIWYQEVELYIDGNYSQTFNIGSSFSVPMAMGFSVPLGSRWQLKVNKTVATKDNVQINLTVYYNKSGIAQDLKTETIKVEVHN